MVNGVLVMELKQLIPLAGMLVMMVLVEIGAMLLSLPMKAAGLPHSRTRLRC